MTELKLVETEGSGDRSEGLVGPALKASIKREKFLSLFLSSTFHVSSLRQRPDSGYPKKPCGNIQNTSSHCCNYMKHTFQNIILLCFKNKLQFPFLSISYLHQSLFCKTSYYILFKNVEMMCGSWEILRSLQFRFLHFSSNLFGLLHEFLVLK